MGQAVGRSGLGIAIVVVAVLALLLLFSAFVPPALSLELSLAAVESPTDDHLADLTLTVKSPTAREALSGEITLPDGFELVEGSLQWETDLEANTPETFTVTVKSVKEGNWMISATAGDAAASASLETTVDADGGISVEGEELVTKVEPIVDDTFNETEFCEKRSRDQTYDISLPGGQFTPDPLKGAAFNEYFQSLDLEEEDVYILMQFEFQWETCAQTPTTAQQDILAQDGFTFFDSYTYAKATRTVLETKSYDFVRWAGVIEEPELKINQEFKDYVSTYENNTLNITIIFYEKPTDDQLNDLEGHVIHFLSDLLSPYTLIDAEIETNKLYDIAALNFVKKIEGKGEIREIPYLWWT